MTEHTNKMKTLIARRFALVVATLLVSGSALAAGGGNLMQADTDLEDRASLQRGAKLYMNYCAGCHSLKYMRYSQLATDLGLTEEQVMQNLNLTGGKFGDYIVNAMPTKSTTPPTGSEKWFGKAPPDLSLISRVRGSDWIYTYLKSFYIDEARPLGWNNSLFPNASMPNPLWQMQGQQTPQFTEQVAAHGWFGEKKDDKGKPIMECPHGTRDVDGKCFTRFESGKAGTQTAGEFTQTVRDITAFLEYVGEPVAIKRQRTGVWVILFLSFFTLLAWMLKKEYWRDVH